MWLPDADVRGIGFTINAENIRLIRSIKSLAKFKAKVLFTVPLRAKSVKCFTNCHIIRE